MEQKLCKDVGRLEDFLADRGWFVDGELTNILKRAQREIDKANDAARVALAHKLKRYRDEARAHAAGTLANMRGEPLTSTAGERRKSRTDAEHIDRVLVKIETGTRQRKQIRRGE